MKIALTLINGLKGGYMSFENAIQIVLEHEGGYSNDKNDAGGATNHGITIGELSRWLGHQATTDEVKELTVDDATKIYRAHYWNIMRLDDIKDEMLQYVLFDQGVLRGPQTAVLAMQRILFIQQDGVVGSQTLAAINNQLNPAHLAMSFMCEMQMDYVHIVKHKPSQIVFLEGWLRRTQDMMLKCV